MRSRRGQGGWRCESAKLQGLIVRRVVSLCLSDRTAWLQLRSRHVRWQRGSHQSIQYPLHERQVETGSNDRQIAKDAQNDREEVAARSKPEDTTSP